MAGRRILVTGVATDLGSRLVRRLVEDPRVEFVGGMDVQEPAADLGGAEFVRVDLRNPLVARVVESTRADTVVHLQITALPVDAGGRSRMKELNVIGTMQLLAAAQKSPRLRTFVMKSTTAVYGSSHRDPALFREDVPPAGVPRSGYARDAVDVESYARGFGRHRPDVNLAILRFANFMGPDVDSALTRYVALPVVPTVFGYDPRLQLVHTEDALDVLEKATLEERGGIYNVAGPGILYLSQAIRLAGKPTVPVMMPFVDGIAELVRRSGVDFSPEQLRFLLFGRVGDIHRLRTVFGFEPQYSTRAAFAEHLAARVTPLVSPEQFGRLEADAGRLAVRAARLAAEAAARVGALRGTA